MNLSFKRNAILGIKILGNFLLDNNSHINCGHVMNVQENSQQQIYGMY